MTPTKTKARDNTTLAEAGKLEAAWAEAERKASDLARQYSEGSRAVQALLDQRRRLTNNDPRLVDEHDKPVSADNEAAKIDAEINRLDEEMGGGLIEFNARVKHGRKLAEAAERDWTIYVRANFDQILEAHIPSGEAARDRVHDALGVTRAAVDDYLALVRRAQALAAAAGISGQDVIALDPAAELARLVDGWELPNPLEIRR